ncbi:MAG: phosphoglucosamine mutase [Ruminococcaceae bacterium]|nr:phosphoglucosamine mutase [Oscillospiraceae bacterium]
MTIGQKIAILRTAMQLSQEQLAEKLSVSRQSVSKWESDSALPEVGKVLQLASLFNITTDDLLRDEIPLEPTYTEALFRPKEAIAFNGKYFGTDGFRGEANVDLDAMHAFKIGRFLGWYYSTKRSNNRSMAKRAKIAVGKDTRRSSYMLEYAIVAGITSSGADACMLHVTTTPSVAYVVCQEHFDCGVMISASHNPYYDNGIKILGGGGEKLDDATLALIESYLDGDLSSFDIEGEDLPLAKRDKLGCIIDYVAGRNRYLGFLISVAANSYRGRNIALDCANGSSWMIAKSVFDALGATTYVINANPDGLNINEQAGSTHIGNLRKYVRDNHLDAGFAFDGDADRCIAVDENGNIINGDHIIYILAERLRSRGLLPGNKVVTTVMSNMGLYKALEKTGIGYHQTIVGDRYVHEAMLQNDYYLGGEQSGHIIVRKYATTGDGILTAILLMEEMIDRKTTLSKLASPVTMYPQSIVNIAVTNKSQVSSDERVKKCVEEIAIQLGSDGRIILRESGTEPVIRVMVECGNEKLCESCTARVAELIKQLGYAKK